MNKNRLAIVGITGRMGQEILSLAPNFHFRTTGGVGTRVSTAPANSSTTSNSSGEILIVPRVEQLRADITDLVIDFSLPQLTEQVTRWCADHRKPLVSGVTGLSPSESEALAAAAVHIPVFWAPNMSLGIAVMARMMREFAHLHGFDFQIEELHHNRKKDRPSGTALYLQRQLEQVLQPNSPEAMPQPLAIRGGGIFGIHRAWAMGEEEMLTLEHTAMNRRVFARGALNAATWLAARPPGLYRMDDVLSRQNP